jgi:hypothetical protein
MRSVKLLCQDDVRLLGTETAVCVSAAAAAAVLQAA